MDKRRELVSIFMEKGILVSPEFVDKIHGSEDKAKKVVDMLSSKDELPAVMNHKIEKLISSSSDVKWEELEHILADAEKKGDPETADRVTSAVEQSRERKEEFADVEVDYSYKDSEKKKDIQTFVSYFNERYTALKNILQNRQELERATSINRVKGLEGKESVSVIGMVKEISVTKNNNIILTLEDLSGEINVLINKNRDDLYQTAQYIVNDEVLAITGTGTKSIIFADTVIFPDIPLHNELKKGPEEVNAAVLGDIHMGSKHFLWRQFKRMISWLKGDFGNDAQKEEAGKIKYLFLVGDLVDGVGIYPGQQEDLELDDIEAQYDELAKYLKEIPKDIQIIVCAGNHDSVRIPEPQPRLPKDFAKSIWDLENVTMVSNPSYVTVGKKDNFPGFSVLLYHGFSFPYIADHVEPIRAGGGLEKPELIMRFLLQKRHLAPSHQSTQYIPDERSDPLVITKVPDLFITGHIHRTTISSYRNVTMINGSTWLGMTDYQEKVGLNPEPGRIPIINLKTRKAKIMRF
ncbi:MAG: DNA-directed DNA polymerase II small subunit [Nanobdellota archaeon]